MQSIKDKRELVLTCSKCGHQLYVDDWDTEKKMKKIMKTDCPNCGEEPEELWRINRFGNYDKERG